MLAVLVAGTVSSYAQNFQGTATYQSANNSGAFKQIKVEGMTPEMDKMLADAIKKAGQNEFTLNFNLSEASWQKVESLGTGPTGVTSMGVQVMGVGGSSSQSIKYRNTAESLYLEEADLMGKAFLVKEELKNLEWELTDETKKIGDYTVQKAVYSKPRTRQMMSFGNDTEDEGKAKVITDTLVVEAWYTTQIPVSHGPDKYWGLPGLILELKDGRTTFLCTKVILNPEDGVEIKKPKKGKKVSREEYTEIQMEKVKGMQEKYSGGSGGGIVFKKGGGIQ